MAAKCCRSIPRCADCPAVAAAATRTRRREAGIALLIDEVLAGAAGPRRELPEPVAATVEALRAARRGTRVALSGHGARNARTLRTT